MQTEFSSLQLVFEGLGKRRVVGKFDGGRMISDGGALLLREADRLFGITGRLAVCFIDYCRWLVESAGFWLKAALLG